MPRERKPRPEKPPDEMDWRSWGRLLRISEVKRREEIVRDEIKRRDVVKKTLGE